MEPYESDTLSLFAPRLDRIEGKLDALIDRLPPQSDPFGAGIQAQTVAAVITFIHPTSQASH